MLTLVSKMTLDHPPPHKVNIGNMTTTTSAILSKLSELLVSNRDTYSFTDSYSFHDNFTLKLAKFNFLFGRGYSQVDYLDIKSTSQVDYLDIKSTSQVDYLDIKSTSQIESLKK